MTEFRDVQCGLDFASLFSLGCFEEEFTYYGCAYLVNEEIVYQVSANEIALYQFVQKSINQNIFTTPVIERITRSKVPSGRRAIMKQEMKKEVVISLRALYNNIYFKSLAQMTRCPNNDHAYGLLEEYKDNILGHFDKDELQLFQGLLNLAMDGKLIGYQHYQEFADWIGRVKKQMEEDTVDTDYFSRTFSGFAFAGVDKKLKFYSNAYAPATTKMHNRYREKGFFVTPIIEKTDWFDNFERLPEVQEGFTRFLSTMLSPSYLSLIKLMNALPAAIDQQLYLDCLEEVKNSCAKEAIQTFLGYGYRWNYYFTLSCQ